MSRKAVEIELSKSEKESLIRFQNRPSTPRKYISRIDIVLLAASGYNNQSIAEECDVNKNTVGKWRNRYAKMGMKGLEDAPRPGRPEVLNENDVEELITAALSEPPKERTHWSTRLLEEETGFSRSTINRTLNKYDIQPHRVRSFKYSDDPKLEEKVVDIVGLYLNPPDRGFIISVDEKTQIQALDRTQTKLPMKSGSPERRTHDYVRNGTTDLFAALEISTGEVLGMCSDTHTSKDFFSFLKKVRKNWPYKTLHIICDNLSAHKTNLIKEWEEKNKRIHFHFTPTSASWMNQIETWFSILQRQMLRRGRYGSVEELNEKLIKFIDGWNKRKHPFEWTKTATEILEKAKRNNTTY